MSAFSYGRAAKYTHVVASQTDSVIESGESIQIYGFVVDGTGTAVFEEADGSTTITEVTVAGAAVESGIMWIADKGLNITTPAGVTVTIFHSQGGA